MKWICNVSYSSSNEAMWRGGSKCDYYICNYAFSVIDFISSDSILSSAPDSMDDIFDSARFVDSGSTDYCD